VLASSRWRAVSSIFGRRERDVRGAAATRVQVRGVLGHVRRDTERAGAADVALDRTDRRP
jgi:hypothetical protein